MLSVDSTAYWAVKGLVKSAILIIMPAQIHGTATLNEAYTRRMPHQLREYE